MNPEKPMIPLPLSPARPAMHTAMAAHGVACGTCRHYSGEHLIYLGPLKLCLESGCVCGRRSLAALGRTLRPWWLTIIALGYLAYHLERWRAVGYRIVRVVGGPL